MKKVICLLLAVILMISLASCGKRSTSDMPDEDSFGAAPAYYATLYLTSNGGEEWLPDWQRTEGGYGFKDVASETMNDYIEKLKREGFGFVGGKWAKMLYRDDAWIEIADNTEAYKSAAISVTVRSSEGLSTDEAAAVIGTGGMSKAPCALIDVTTEGLFGETGITIFKALFDEPPYEGVDDPLFTVKTFIIGGGKAYEASGLIDIARADIDSDGAVEAIVLECGPTSGVFSLVLRVFGIKNGEAAIKADSMYILKHGSFALSVVDGKPYLASGGRNYLLTVEENTVKIDDPNNELGHMGD